MALADVVDLQYYMYKEDVARIAALGVNAHSFSYVCRVISVNVPEALCQADVTIIIPSPAYRGPEFTPSLQLIHRSIRKHWTITRIVRLYLSRSL